MQFRRGRDRQRRVLRSVNHGSGPAGGCTWAGWHTRKVEGRSAYLNYNIPTGGTQGPLPALRRPPSLPALPLVQPLPPPPPPFRLTQAACRNLINLPVASRLAPCRHSEILYPSHPLKSEPAVERTAPSPLRPLALAIRARLPCSVAPYFPLVPPFFIL